MDQRSSRWTIQNHRTQLTHFPNCEMPDARIASALNKIIQNSYFQNEVSLEEMKAQKKIGSFAEDRLLT